ncbi:Thioredoxin-like protein, partial [Globisporangium splendens]
MSAAAAAAALRANTRLLVAAAKNGRAIACDVDATKFILVYPRGAYTAARTVEQTKIFDYDGHIKRLVDSTLVMQSKQEASGTSDAVSSAAAVEAVLRPRTEATLRAAMEEFHQQFGAEPAEEYKITVLVCNAEGDDASTTTISAKDDPLKATDVYCHVGLLPPIRSGRVKLVIAGSPRENASAKDSAWVRERKAIYDAMSPDVEEVILMEPATHLLLEGSQTNFYAIRGGAIYTAEDGILKGTVRSLVLEVCQEHGIPVVLTPPSLDDIGEWEGCFISSTSRLVLGAASIAYEDPVSKGKKIKNFGGSSVLGTIIESVRQSVVRKSTIVF